MNYMIRLKRIIKNTIDSSFFYYVILLVIFVLGTIIGSLLLKVFRNDTSLRFINIVSPYIEYEFSGLDFFKKSININYLYLVISFIFGLFNLGFLSTILIFIRGSLLGLTVGYMIQNYGIKGFFISVLGIYPQFIIYIPCIILAGVLSILFDTRTNLINKRKNRIIKINLYDYVNLFVLLVVIMTIGSFYEGFISPIFFKF